MKKMVLTCNIFSFIIAVMAFAGGEKGIYEVVDPRDGTIYVEEWAEVVDWQSQNSYFFLALDSQEHIQFLQSSTDYLGAFFKEDGFYKNDPSNSEVLGDASLGVFENEKKTPVNIEFNKFLPVQEKIRQRAEALCRYKGYERVIPEKFDPTTDVLWMNTDLHVISLIENPGHLRRANRATLTFIPGPFSGEVESNKSNLYTIQFPVKKEKSLKAPNQVFHRVWCGKKLEKGQSISLKSYDYVYDLDRKKVMEVVEKDSRDYAKQMKEVQSLGNSEEANFRKQKILDEYKRFVMAISSSQDLLAKIFYEIVEIFPSTDLLDVLMSEGLDPLHMIHKKNDLGINSNIDRHLCRFATIKIIRLGEQKEANEKKHMLEQAKESGRMLGQAKVFTLHLFTKIAMKSEKNFDDFVDIANEAIKESKSIKTVALRDKPFGEIIEKIKSLMTAAEHERDRIRGDLSQANDRYNVANKW